MAIRLHAQGFDNALRLIKAHEIEMFKDWGEIQPTPDEINKFIRTHFMHEYGLWFLGIDDDFSSETKEHYVYPYGDLKEVQYCALTDTLENAQNKGHQEIVKAAQQLLDMIEKQG